MPSGKKVSYGVVPTSDVFDNNINIKHRCQQPYIASTSGHNRVPGSATGKDLDHCHVITHNFNGLVGPGRGPNFKGYHNIKNL